MKPPIPNKPGIVCEIVACTGQTKRTTFRIYFCVSTTPRVHPGRYSSKVKKRLKEGVTWEITQVLPKPRRIQSGDWELVKRYRMTIVTETEKNADIWPHLSRAILQQFSTPNRVLFTVDFYAE